eukprot:3060981-Rhodomonas_salina.3
MTSTHKLTRECGTGRGQGWEGELARGRVDAVLDSGADGGASAGMEAMEAVEAGVPLVRMRRRCVEIDAVVDPTVVLRRMVSECGVEDDGESECGGSPARESHPWSSVEKGVDRALRSRLTMMTMTMTTTEDTGDDDDDNDDDDDDDDDDDR